MAPGLSTLFTYDVPKNYTAITFGNNSLVVAQSDSDDSMIMAYENDIPKGYKTMKSKKGNKLLVAKQNFLSMTPFSPMTPIEPMKLMEPLKFDPIKF